MEPPLFFHDFGVPEEAALKKTTRYLGKRGKELPMDDDTIDYAIRNTRVLYAPDRRIDSFGETRFNFRLLTETMDEVGVTRIRSGWVETGKPRIYRPADLREIDTDGFSREAARFFRWLQAHGARLQPLLRYGFRFSRSQVAEEVVHEDIREVADRVVAEALASGDSLRAVICGVDAAWEASLLRFMLEMVQNSHEINVFDFRRRGLL